MVVVVVEEMLVLELDIALVARTVINLPHSGQLSMLLLLTVELVGLARQNLTHEDSTSMLRWRCLHLRYATSHRAQENVSFISWVLVLLKISAADNLPSRERRTSFDICDACVITQ